MIYTLQEGQSFDAEILRQELVAALGTSTGWHLNTAGNQVDFIDEIGVGFAEGDIILAHFANGAVRTANATILKQIAELEATQTPRRVREGGQWMIDLDAEIAVLRGQLL